jgi:hypothetical protein
MGMSRGPGVQAPPRPMTGSRQAPGSGMAPIGPMAGLYKLNPVAPSRFKPPGFDP